MWRPIVHDNRLATLREIEEHWSLDDLLEAHIALDVVDELKRKANQPPPK